MSFGGPRSFLTPMRDAGAMARAQFRFLVVSLTAVLAVSGCGSATQTLPEPPPRTTARTATVAAALGSPGLRVGHPAWVTVSVATVWRSRTSPHRVDRPALAHPVRIRRWLSRMSLDQRRSLGGRADTQAILGERVRVVALRPGWARVVVPDQPSQLDRRGYPGWVPVRQLTAKTPAHSARRVTVTARLTYLRSDDAAADRRLEVSYGTRLRYLGRAGRWVRVALPSGAVRRVRAAAVSVHRPGEPALPATRRDLVRAATMFVGLPYLWSGLTGFGFDCSGLTWLDYRTHGIVIPRDARPQSMSGTVVRAGKRRKGDLIFYATNGIVHHVTMYIGHGRVVQAPHTGSSTQVTPVARYEYAGTRRYLS